MTFEARDSAAKVVPARFKVNPGQRGRSGGQGSRRTTSKHIFRKTLFSIYLLKSFINGFLFCWKKLPHG